MSNPSKNWFEVVNHAGGNTSDMMIYDFIGKDFTGSDGIAAKEFGEAFNKIPLNHEILVRINSRGGNVSDGLAIHGILQTRKNQVRTHVDGVAASIASVIACAGKKCVMGKGALMMKHAPSALPVNVINAKEAREIADKLDKMSDLLAGIYAEKTGRTQKQELDALNAGEKWMTAQDAKEAGYCDEIAGDDAAAKACLEQPKAFDYSVFAADFLKTKTETPPENFMHTPNVITASDSARHAWTEMANNITKRGGEFAVESAPHRSKRTSEIWADAREKLLPVFNAAANNAIDPALKRVAILNETVRDFALRLLPLRMFSTVFENVPLQGTDQVAVAFYPLQGAASQQFADGDGTNGTGYQFGQQTNTNSRLITVNQRLYQPLDYSSNNFRRQPFFDAVKLGKMNAEKLAADILISIFANFTPANYPTIPQSDPNFNPNLNLPAAGYNSDQIVDLETVATNLNWPDSGRALITGTTLKNILAKDPTYKLALNIGTPDVIQGAKFPKISGFDYACTPNFPSNGVNLIGIIAFANALAAAFSPVDPAPGVRQQLVSYEIATDLQTGISMNYRHWGAAQADRDYEIIESAFGSEPINEKGAQLLTRP